MARTNDTNRAFALASALRGQDASKLPASVAGPRLMVVFSTAMLVILGLVMVFSASSVEGYVENEDAFSYVRNQFLFAIFGVLVCVLIARVLPHRVWMGRFTYFAFGVSLLLLVLTAAMGTIGLGAQRWLTIGPISFQPSELAKVGVLLMVAKLVYDYQEGRLPARTFGIIFAVLNLLIVALILVSQSDLGTTLICIVGIMAIFWLSEMPLKWIGVYAGVVAVLGSLAMLVGYRWQRVLSFLDPWSDTSDAGYQLIHSFYAFAQGGIFGVGLGHSAEKYFYLPERHTDFIFSVIGEELGLVGAFAVIALFLLFLLGGLRMAQSSPDRFGAILCGSFAVIIVFQAFLNIGCVIGLLPITGKPLPFISSGGTSLVISLVMVGIMLSVSHASDEPPQYRQRRENLRVLREEPLDYEDRSQMRRWA